MKVASAAFALVLSVCQAASAPPSIMTAALKADVDAFFDREVASHVLQIPADGALPDRVHGALTTGEFSWGTFARATRLRMASGGTSANAALWVMPRHATLQHSKPFAA